MENKYDEIDTSTIVQECLADNLQGWHKELWYDKNTKKFSFSGWMTNNSWNQSNDDDDIHVCSFDAIDLTDNGEISSLQVDETGMFETDIDTEGLDTTTIENCKLYYKCEDGNQEISENFPLINQREKILLDIEQFSILNYEEAVDALINIAENEYWYEDELGHIWDIQNDSIDENCVWCKE